MAKLSKEEKEKIIKRDLPGYKLVEEAREDSPRSVLGYDSIDVKPEAGTPDFRELRRKYFGADEDSTNEGRTFGGAHEGASDNPGDESDDDEIVKVEPENRPDALDRGGRAKSVVISRGEVKGSQG
jgi:hypothetical protein